jgi:hypothetical protein
VLAPLHRHLSPSPRVELATFSACGSPAAIQCWTRSQRHSHAGRLELRFASVLPSLPAVTQRTRPVGVHANYGLGTSYIALCACAGRGTCASRHDGALALVRCFLGFDAVSALSPLTAIRTRGLGCLSQSYLHYRFTCISSTCCCRSVLPLVGREAAFSSVTIRVCSTRSKRPAEDRAYKKTVARRKAVRAPPSHGSDSYT